MKYHLDNVASRPSRDIASKRTRSLFSVVLAMLTVIGVFVGVVPAQATPADSGKNEKSVPNLVLKLTGMTFPEGGSVRTATVTTRGTNAAATTEGVAANTCYLDGSLPSLLPTENLMTENVYFPAQFRCDADVVGTPELTAAVQSGFMGGYTTEKIVGPVRGNPVGLGVIIEKNCVDIALGVWRGVARPRLITDTVIYDWGWIPTYDASLSCG